MRRILLVLTVAAMMAVMMVVMSGAALADVDPEKPGKNGGGPPTFSGKISGTGGALVAHTGTDEGDQTTVYNPKKDSGGSQHPDQGGDL